MNNCLNCGKPVKNKYCNTTCQNKTQNTIRANKKYGVLKDFNVKCSNCGDNFVVKEREKLHPKKENYYCSRSCANVRKHNEETKNKIRDKLNKGDNTVIRICRNCQTEFSVPYNKRNQESCSRSCNIQFRNKNENLASKGGKASATKQSKIKRSKNEIYFAELCIEKFENVLTNEPMFNGWDADIIIEDYKVAILWNGKWHYEKITEKHSIKQVQNRDKIKINEIINAGYKPYVIKDMGKFNKPFVNEKFQTLLEDLELSCGS